MGHITGHYAALLALLLFVLSLRVIQARVAGRVLVGLGDSLPLLRASRAQGNFIEYVPIVLLLILLLELQAAPPWLLHALGSMTVAGRIAHALGISREPENLRLRQLGMGLTFTALLVGAVALLLR